MSTPRNAELVRSTGNQLDALAQTIERRIAELDAQGTRNATYYYRDGRYLYINYDDDGRRVRGYVGVDPQKQAAAIAQIERHRERVRLEYQLGALKTQRAELDRRLAWLQREFLELAQATTEALTGKRKPARVGDAGACQVDWICHQAN